MLNFVLCDDNTTFLDGLEKSLNRLILKNDFDAKVGFKATNISDVLDYMRSNKTDVLFLDIVLKSDENGVDFAEKIRAVNKDIYIIFTTGHLEYALIAYQVKAFDYLPKPITIERLEKTLFRLFDDINFSSSSFIPVNSKTYVNQKDVYYIKREGMKLVFKTNSDTFETYSSFSKMSDKLPSNFIRCHKSYIANVDNISHVEASTNTLFFDNCSKCYIGPKYKDNFMEVINNGVLADNLDASINA